MIRDVEVEDATPAAASNREGGHHYVRLGHFYVNKSLGPRRLWRYLWEQFDQFLGDEGKSMTNRSSWRRVLPSKAFKGSVVTRLVARYLASRHNGSGNPSELGGRAQEIVLPVAGHLALSRRSGAMKVLDVDEKKVYTLIKHGGERVKLSERVECSRKVSGFPFAPGLREVDLENGYFAEDFLGGRHPKDFKGCGDDFVEVYRPLLLQFLTALPVREVDARRYVDSLLKEIESPDGLLARMPVERKRQVQEFVDCLKEPLGRIEGKIPLVLSHGDFFSGNIVIHGGEHRAIDWANMGHRSPLHDLYYLFMNHCCRVLDSARLHERIGRAIEELDSGLALEDATVHARVRSHLSNDPDLRRLFYLECVHVPLVRSSDPSDRYLDSMLERIGWFKDFERHLEAQRI